MAKDNKQAKQLRELTDEELEQVTGGRIVAPSSINNFIKKLFCFDDEKDELGNCSPRPTVTN